MIGNITHKSLLSNFTKNECSDSRARLCLRPSRLQKTCCESRRFCRFTMRIQQTILEKYETCDSTLWRKHAFCPSSSCTSNTLQFVLYKFSSDLIYYSFLAARAAQVVIDLLGSDSIWKFIDVIFDEQNLILNESTADKTRNQVIQILADIAAKIGIDKEEFLREFSEGKNQKEMKTQWNYAVHRGVVKTPTVFLNDFKVDEFESSWTLEEWMKKIDPYLK